MKRPASRSDCEARIKATAWLLHSPGALRTGAETRAAGMGEPGTGIAYARDGAARDVWWWAGRLVAAIGFVAAVVAPWLLLLAERVLNRELPR